MPPWLAVLRLVLAGLVWAGVAAPSTADAPRTALIIGISDYDQAPDLPNAVPDARAVADRFRDLGYDTHLVLNPDRQQLLQSLARLRLASAKAAQVVIYFSGHGTTLDGESYLFPRDADPQSDRMQDAALPLRVLIRAVSDRPRQKIIFLDACREPPLARTGSDAPQAAPPPAGLFIAYAAQPGEIAYDGAGAHSPFSAALLDQLSRPARQIEDLMRGLRVRVIQQTQGRQVPWSRSSLLSRATLGPPLPPQPRTE